MLPAELEAVHQAIRGYPGGRVDDVGTEGECVACRDGPSADTKIFVCRRDPDGKGFKRLQKHFKTNTHHLNSQVMMLRRHKGASTGRAAQPGGTLTPALDKYNDTIRPLGEVPRSQIKQVSPSLFAHWLFFLSSLSLSKTTHERDRRSAPKSTRDSFGVAVARFPCWRGSWGPATPKII